MLLLDNYAYFLLTYWSAVTFKEVFQMQIGSDINSRRRRHNQYSLSCFTRSASLFVFIYFTFLGLVSLFQGVFLVRLLAFVLFVALLFLLASVGYLALDCRQQEFRLWW